MGIEEVLEISLIIQPVHGAETKPVGGGEGGPGNPGANRSPARS